MGGVLIMLLKKITLLSLIISASFLSTSFAGRASRFGKKLAEQELDVTSYDQEMSSSPSLREEESSSSSSSIHERLLRVNTKDYGNYDPAPALVRPPFKLIPN